MKKYEFGLLYKIPSSEKILELTIHGIDKDDIPYCRELLKGMKELTPDLIIKMKIDGI